MAEIGWSPAVDRAYRRLSIPDQAHFFRAIDRLRQFPESGKMVVEGRYRGCRGVPFGEHWLLYYRVVGPERRCVLRMIRHGSQRPV